MQGYLSDSLFDVGLIRCTHIQGIVALGVVHGKRGKLIIVTIKAERDIFLVSSSSLGGCCLLLVLGLDSTNGDEQLIAMPVSMKGDCEHNWN